VNLARDDGLIVREPCDISSVRSEVKVFLSYRRVDSADVSGRIFDRLVVEFGSRNVFKDVDSIPLRMVAAGSTILRTMCESKSNKRLRQGFT